MQQDDRAPFLSIGHQAFQSIEYPGPIGPSTSSLEKALRTLGHQEDLDTVFNKAQQNLELRFRPDDHWAHPVSGDRATTHRLLLKVTRRRRRCRSQEAEAHTGVDGVGGLYKVDIPGTIKQTVRFRGQSPRPVKSEKALLNYLA
jgi:general transcription factor 3C polypeptide 5 (transcription factor C subunit 1)